MNGKILGGTSCAERKPELLNGIDMLLSVASDLRSFLEEAKATLNIPPKPQEVNKASQPDPPPNHRIEERVRSVLRVREILESCHQSVQEIMGVIREI